MQIFHALWLVDDGGRHPTPYTLVSADPAAGMRVVRWPESLEDWLRR
jgi:hypothetical protein